MGGGSIGVDRAHLHHRDAWWLVLEDFTFLQITKHRNVVVDIQHLDIDHGLGSQLILVLHAHDQRVSRVALVVKMLRELDVGSILV